MDTFKPFRILLVDDNRDFADSLALLLRWMGHEIHVTYDGGDAFAEACAWTPDVMLVDIAMPGMDGNALAQQIRRHPEVGKIVILAVSGFADERHRQEAQAAGFEHYAVKPVDHWELSAWIRERLQGRIEVLTPLAADLTPV